MRLQIFLILTTLYVISIGQCKEDPDDRVLKLAKSYDLINKHLLKHVDSDDVEANMVEANRWLNSRLFKLTVNLPLKKALKQFVKLPEILANSTMCNIYGTEILETVSNGLSSTTRLKESNYPRQRIDKLLEHYSFEFALLCNDWIRFLWEPNIGFGFKQIAYERINLYLEQTDKEGGNAERSMELVKNKFVDWNRENKDGALTDAAKQIISLETILNENKCTYVAYEILIKNELATRQRRVTKSVRRLNQLFNSYAQKHAHLCQEIYPEKFKVAIKQLDEATLRSVLVLTSEFYFHYRKYMHLTGNIDHSEYKQINNEQFTTPEIVALMTKLNQVLRIYLNKQEYEMSYYVTNQLLLRALRLIITDSHPDYIYLTRALRKQGKVVDIGKVRDLYVNYLIEPCARFKEVVDKDIMVPFDFDYTRMENTVATRRDELTKGIGFKLGKSASSICGIVLGYGDSRVAEMVVSQKL